MRTRPNIKVGDIVKLSKKGKKFPRNFFMNTTMVVSEIQGLGTEGSSVVTCRLEIDGKFEKRSFYRSELWSTGKNAFFD
jgi:hypothetical protein